MEGDEVAYVQESMLGGHAASGGPFAKRAAAMLAAEAGAPEVLMTTSCTSALELSAMLLDLGPGDTVIVPSFTFTTTALAYVRQGAGLVFLFGEQPSDRLIPPAVNGTGGVIAFSGEPDLAAARRLAGDGKRRAATLYYCGESINRRIAEIVRSNLAQIGIDVRIDASLGCLTGPETRRLAAADLQLVSNFDALPDPGAFLEFALGNPYSVPAWRDPGLRARSRPRAGRTAPSGCDLREARASGSCAMPCRSRSTRAASIPSSSPLASAAR